MLWELALIYQDKIFLNKKIAFGLILITILSKYVGLFDIAFIAFFPYIIFTLGYGTNNKLSDFAKKREISYEIYLWGWPVQQIICCLYGGEMSPYLNMLYAIIIAIILGISQSILQDKMKSLINFNRKGFEP